MCLYATYAGFRVPNVVSPRSTTAPATPELYKYPYSATTNYNLGPNAVPNGQYAQNGAHPSEYVVGSQKILDAHGGDVRQSNDLMMDSEKQIGNSSLFIHVTMDTDDTLIGDATQSHHYGYATVENIGTCDWGSQKVGSICRPDAAPGDRPSYRQGLCYYSTAGTLECGRTLAIDSRWGTAPKMLSTGDGAGVGSDSTSLWKQWNDVDTKIHRVPGGTTLTHYGKTNMKRLLIAGCMIPTDPNYKYAAEIHIAEDCYGGDADYKKGCIFPGALNYAPGSVQSGWCQYKSDGCTSPTALNYNSEATDNDGSCVEPIVGCTLKTDAYMDAAGAPMVYANDANGVPVGTPMKFNEDGSPSTGTPSRYVGQLTVNVGRVVYTGYKSVINAKADANVNVGCQIAIEGCMDSTAANYEPKANVNSNTWCIPIVRGCMMPDPRASGTQANGVDRLHMKDGGSGIFNPSATVHDKSMCSVGRLGCTSTTAINYDPKASINDGTCFERVDACLDRSALNFNCTTREKPEACNTTARYPSPRGSVHSEYVCIYEVMSPPPPSPNVPWGLETQLVVNTEMGLSGSVEDYTPERVDALVGAFAAKFGFEESKVSAEVRPASVIMEFRVIVDDAAAASSVISTIAAEVGSVAGASAIFADLPDEFKPKIVSVSPPVEKIIAAVTPPGPPPQAPVGAIIGGVVGALVGLAILGGLYVMQSKKKGATTYPA